MWGCYVGMYVWETSRGHEPKQMPAGSAGSTFPSVAIYFRGAERREGSRLLGGFKDTGHRLACHNLEVRLWREKKDYRFPKLYTCAKCVHT